MSINALNFCGFAMCYDYDQSARGLGGLIDAPAASSGNEKSEGQESTSGLSAPADIGKVAGSSADLSQLHQTQSKPVLLAAPNALDSGGIDFFHLPSEIRLSTLRADKDVKTGMVMTLSLFHHSATGELTVVSGYEDGHTMVHIRRDPRSPAEPWSWKKVLVSQPHSQPLLSLEVSSDGDFFYTSSADAMLAKFAVPSTSLSTAKVVQKPAKSLNTKHAGQQGLTVRSDGRLFATAGWDARIRVYSARTMNELAVLKWHKEGCYAVAFAQIHPNHTSEVDMNVSTASTVVSIATGSALGAIRQQRSAKAQSTHWLAAGGKDGKISLWDIY